MDLRCYLPSYRDRREQIHNVALQTLLSLFGRALGPAPRHNTRRFTDTTENFTLSLTYYSLITHHSLTHLLTHSLTPSLTHSLAPVRAEQSSMSSSSSSEVAALARVHDRVLATPNDKVPHSLTHSLYHYCLTPPLTSLCRTLHSLRTVSSALTHSLTLSLTHSLTHPSSF